MTNFDLPFDFTNINSVDELEKISDILQQRKLAIEEKEETSMFSEKITENFVDMKTCIAGRAYMKWARQLLDSGRITDEGDIEQLERIAQGLPNFTLTLRSYMRMFEGLANPIEILPEHIKQKLIKEHII